MVKEIAALAIQVALCLASCECVARPAPEGGCSLAGRWEPTHRPSGGITTVIDIDDSGGVSCCAAVVVDTAYTVGEDGAMTIRGLEDLKAEPGEATFCNGRLIIGGVESVRMGGQSDGHEIVGTWTSKYSDAADAYERYSPDGIRELRIPIRTVVGVYAVEQNVMTMTLAGKRTSWVMKWNGENLCLAPVGSDAWKEYRRTSRWYPISRHM